MVQVVTLRLSIYTIGFMGECRLGGTKEEQKKNISIKIIQKEKNK